MKDFYTQMMKDLYALTGIEQVTWMLRDLKEGERNFDLCVAGMVHASTIFPYIPEAEQQKIIRKMMLEDKDYTSLNSRTIYKWLNMHKDVYWSDQTHFVEVEHEPAPPEVADFYAKQLLDNIQKIGTGGTKQQGIKDPIVRQLKEKFKVQHDPIVTTHEDVKRRELHDEWIRDNYDKFGQQKPGYLPENEWLEIRKSFEAEKTKSVEQ